MLTTHAAAAARLDAERTARRLSRESSLVGGVPLGELRRHARSELFRLRDESDAGLSGMPAGDRAGTLRTDPEAPLIATGHQPELFHPGVWAKNIAADAIVRPWKTSACNLIVDNDLQGRSSVTIPTGSRDEPMLAELPFDDPGSPRPWEESRIASTELFASFGTRLERSLAPWSIVPWGASLWPTTPPDPKSNLVAALVSFRRRAEQVWNVNNREHLLSRLSSMEAFRIFASAILVDAVDFRDRHNRALDDYRQRHRIRSEAHPVAALQEEGGAVESPFWVWRPGDRQRGRLFVRWQGRAAVELLQGRQSLKSRGVQNGNPHAAVIELLADVEREGWKIRTRALTTTLFARLILSDLFIHGIGGARYDELTDDIIRTFFGIDPPPFMVMTATLRLPLGELFPARPEDGGRIRWTMNDQRWNPERYLPPSERAAALARKISIVESIGRGRPPTQIEQLRELRAGWLGGIADSMANVRKETVTVERQLAANRRLASRDFAWPLHPRETLETLWDRLRDALAIG